MLLFFFKDGGGKVKPRFHLCVSDVNQGSKEVGWVQDLPRAVKNRECALKVECRGVWNL